MKSTKEITIISAGIPCQPYSLAGKGLGDLDERDLEQEYMRVVGELKPKWAVIENTPGLFSRKNQRYFHRILDDFSALGYSVAWGMWGAVDVGAPHERQRIFIVAHVDGERRRVCETYERVSDKRLDESLNKTSLRTRYSEDSLKKVGMRKTKGEYKKAGCNLVEYVAVFPSPVASGKLNGGSGSYRKLERLKEKGEINETEFQSMTAGNGGKLNPTWVEWLMGFPLGWSDLDVSEMQ